jgi:hypothetical protein
MAPGPTGMGQCTAKDHLRLLPGLTGPVVKGRTRASVAALPSCTPDVAQDHAFVRTMRRIPTSTTSPSATSP